MEKSANSKHTIYIATACMAVAMVILWSMVFQSVSISFVYREKGVVFLALAYVQLSLLTTWALMRSDLIQRGAALLPKRDRWWGVGGAVIGPLLVSYVFLLLFPLIGDSFAGKIVSKKFTYISSEPYARASRGLVQLNLIDDRGRKHAVVFKTERADKLAMKCGETVATRGRELLLGYVIDSEAKESSPAKPCPQG